jgi:tetratricopeptide (TPR) repeat protein
MPLNRLAACLLACAIGLTGMAAPVFAQSGEGPPAGKPQPRPKPRPPKEFDPAPPQSQATPAPDAQPVSPSAAADPTAKLFGKLPQTAAEKTRQLGDLYALLATAEDEEHAKKISGRIERLWTLYGSDTVSLLLERANKAMGEKHPRLAEKLLDHAVAMAPDYAEAFNRRAFFHFTENNFEAAVGDLRRVLALDPNHYKALEGLAQIWKETGNKRGAYQVMKQLIEIHPFAPGAKTVYEELKREVEGQGI